MDEFWSYLTKKKTELKRENVRLRIEIKGNQHNFKVNWKHPGREFSVLTEEGISRKPANAAKEVFGNLLPQKGVGNIARKYGSFIDISESPPSEIIRYDVAEDSIWKTKDIPAKEKISITTIVGVKTYFTNPNAYQQGKINKNILNRRKLWEVFLEKKEMTLDDFKHLSKFKPKGTTGFGTFLKRNGIASKKGDTYTLNEEVIPAIKELLYEKS